MTTNEFKRQDGAPEAVLEGDMIILKERTTADKRISEDTRKKVLAMLRAGK